MVKKEHIGGAYWNCILANIFFLFDSFGFTGFKEFIINNDKKIIDKLLYGLKNFNGKDNRIIVPVNFLVESYERESQSSKSNLTDTAKDFFLHD